MAFIFGILAAFLALTAQVFVWLFHPTLFTLVAPLTHGIIFSILFLASTEEVARILFVRQYLKSYAKNHPVFAALFFSIGFSFLEIALAYWSGFSLAVLGASAFHLLATSLAFWWLREKSTLGAIFFLFIILTLFHSVFNLGILSFSP